MPRRKRAEAAEAAVEPVNPPGAEPATPATGTPAPADAPFAERHEMQNIVLGPMNDSPSMRLFRSEKYQQMQIQFDEKPDERYRTRLREAGWKWRTAEQVWTKQFEPGARWRTPADAEKLFAEIGNAIRAERGLPPVRGAGR
jgi:hypothetical protein